MRKRFKLNLHYLAKFLFVEKSTSLTRDEEENNFRAPSITVIHDFSSSTAKQLSKTGTARFTKRLVKTLRTVTQVLSKSNARSSLNRINCMISQPYQSLPLVALSGQAHFATICMVSLFIDCVLKFGPYISNLWIYEINAGVHIVNYLCDRQ